GKAPWKDSGDSLASVAVQLTRDPEPLDVEGLPELVRSTILRALAKEREARFPSIDAILRVLEPFVAGSASDLPADSQTETMRTPPDLRGADAASAAVARTEIPHSTPHVPESPPAPIKPALRRSGARFTALALTIVAAAALAIFLAVKPPRELMKPPSVAAP